MILILTVDSVTEAITSSLLQYAMRTPEPPFSLSFSLFLSHSSPILPISPACFLDVAQSIAFVKRCVSRTCDNPRCLIAITWLRKSLGLTSFTEKVHFVGEGEKRWWFERRKNATVAGRLQLFRYVTLRM